ncbi:hypothetical protein AB1Y20_005363 [Prymnesium parvum]|uniref:Uncharacterized protein n=1 Tax=Prymnesium parvum TaxID=97485 RepID=A0AB34J6A7_PRYPA
MAEVAADAALPVDAALLLSVNSALVLATVISPLLSADLVDAPCAALRASLPHIGASLASALRRAAGGCERFRARRQLLFMLIHGAVTYATGDAIAQAALAARSGGGSAEPREARREKIRRRRAVRWRPVSSARAALVGVLSDTVPFYFWSVGLDRLEGSWVTRIFPLLLRKPSLLLATKVGAHLLTFQPVCTASYLLLQQLFRGQPWSNAMRFVRRKFVAAFAPAFVSFLAGGPIVYSLPSVLLQGALRNLGVLVISVYLAVVASNNT